MPNKYGFKSDPNKGKFHPSAIGPGQAGVSVVEKQKANDTTPGGTGGASSRPAGVRARSGAEQLGTKTVTKQATSGAPGGSGKGANATPGGVRQHSGNKAPRSHR